MIHDWYWWVWPTVISLLAFAWAYVCIPRAENGNVLQLMLTMVRFCLAALVSVLVWLLGVFCQ